MGFTAKRQSTRHYAGMAGFRYYPTHNSIGSGFREHSVAFGPRDFDAIYDAPPQRQPLGSAMEVVTDFGDPKTMMGLSMLLMAYGNDKSRETGKLMSSAFVGGGLAVLGLKQAVRRKRPLEDELGDPSFPSGHTSIAFSMATLLGHQYPRWRIPLYVGAGLVGLSRIYLGRHYASDVLMGAAVGTISGTVVWRNRITLLSWKF